MNSTVQHSNIPAMLHHDEDDDMEKHSDSEVADDKPCAPYFYYRDFSALPDPKPNVPVTAPGRIPSFPAKMFAILSRPELADIVSWMPHGRSWKVHKPREFEIKVIPSYFEHAKFSSFIRQANGWGFRRMLSKGPDHNSYYHELFLRGLPHLLKRMKRPAPNAKPLADAKTEPDFYLISEMSPLPESKQLVSSDKEQSSSHSVMSATQYAAQQVVRKIPAYPTTGEQTVDGSSPNFATHQACRAAPQSIQSFAKDMGHHHHHHNVMDDFVSTYELHCIFSQEGEGRNTLGYDHPHVASSTGSGLPLDTTTSATQENIHHVPYFQEYCDSSEPVVPPVSPTSLLPPTSNSMHKTHNETTRACFQEHGSNARPVVLPSSPSLCTNTNKHHDHPTFFVREPCANHTTQEEGLAVHQQTRPVVVQHGHVLDSRGQVVLPPPAESTETDTTTTSATQENIHHVPYFQEYCDRTEPVVPPAFPTSLRPTTSNSLHKTHNETTACFQEHGSNALPVVVSGSPSLCTTTTTMPENNNHDETTLFVREPCAGHTTQEGLARPVVVQQGHVLDSRGLVVPPPPAEITETDTTTSNAAQENIHPMPYFQKYCDRTEPVDPPGSPTSLLPTASSSMHKTHNETTAWFQEHCSALPVIDPGSPTTTTMPQNKHHDDPTFFVRDPCATHTTQEEVLPVHQQARPVVVQQEHVLDSRALVVPPPPAERTETDHPYHHSHHWLLEPYFHDFAAEEEEIPPEEGKVLFEDPFTSGFKLFEFF